MKHIYLSRSNSVVENHCLDSQIKLNGQRYLTTEDKHFHYKKLSFFIGEREENPFRFLPLRPERE